MACNVIINGAAGRMGQTLVGLALADPDFELAGVVEPKVERLEGLSCAKGASLAEVLAQTGPEAVVIDFTAPEVSVNTAKTVAETGAAAVIGTTGLTPDQLNALHDVAAGTRLVWAPNMSVGINTLLAVLPELVSILGPAYDLEISEIHHNKKKDAPSGTALKLAECLAQARGQGLNDIGCFARHGIIGERPEGELGVMTLRGGDVVGDHTVYFLGPGERIEVTHRAHSRETFARGALRAAAWLSAQQPGRLYAMADVLA
jgi:4-hydroxy-tetrahydrodipicolinate reductase